MDFYGQPIGFLQNEHLRLEYLAQAGPRIVRLQLPNHVNNLLGEFPDINWEIPGGTFEIFGGHRLWAAPEQPGFSYQPDSHGLWATENGASVEMIWEPPAGQGLEKRMGVALEAGRAAVHLVHTITNRLDHSVRAAPWGITVFPLGGVAYIPNPARDKALPGDSQFVLWPYSKAEDPRLKLEPAGITVRGESAEPPLKVGSFVQTGDCAYLREGVLLLKRFQVLPGEYPDSGSNVEVYCSDRLIELETLACYSDLKPGDSASFEETWEIFTGAQAELKIQEIFPSSQPAQR